jgi:flagellar hook protein FlgE
VQGYALNTAGIATAGTPSAITLNTGAIAPQATTTADLTANLNSNVSPQVTSTVSSTSFASSYITAPSAAGSDTITVATSSGATALNTAGSILIGNGDGTTNLYHVKSVSGKVLTLTQSLSNAVSANTAVSQNTLGIKNLSTSGILAGYDIQVNTTGVTSGDPYQFLDTVASVNSGGTVNLSNAMPLSGTFTTGGSVIAGPANDYYSTTINVYDSLGNSLPLTATFAPSSSTSGNWNIYYSINGTGATRPNTSLTTPDIVFNPNGGITSGVSQTITDVPSYVTPAPPTLPDGATEPLTIALNLNNLTQYAAPSATTAFTQNGYATGTLTSFTVDQSGRISGQYSNGQTQYIAQVALANFIAPTGLTSEGNSLYAQTFASGQPAVGVANSGNFGYITDSALEQSNVNISSEFTNMIVAQNAYVANSKVLTTENSVLTALESSVQ